MKAFTRFSLLGLTVALSACGGGGGDAGSSGGNSTQATTKVNQTFYAIDYTAIENKEEYDFDITKLPVNDSKATDSAHNTVFAGQYVLTSTSLYKPDYKFSGSLQLNSLTNWTFNLLPEVSSTFDYEKVDLNGQSIYDQILPGYRAYLDFLQNSSEPLNAPTFTMHAKARLLKNKTAAQFSGDAFCLRKKGIEFNQDILTFDTSYGPLKAAGTVVTYDGLLNYFSEMDKQPDISVTIERKVLNSHRWSIITSTVRSDGADKVYRDTLIEYSGNAYVATYVANQRVDTEAQLTLVNKQLTDTSDVKQKALLKLAVAEIEQGCDYYNETAVKQVIQFVR
jgi:hypothetical protein